MPRLTRPCDPAGIADALAALGPASAMALAAAERWLAAPDGAAPPLLQPLLALCPDPHALRRLLLLCAPVPGAVAGLADHLGGGWREGQALIPGFDPVGYEVLSARRRDPPEAAILHYAREGMERGLDPDPQVGARGPTAPGAVLLDLVAMRGDPVFWLRHLLQASGLPPLVALDRSPAGHWGQRLADSFVAELRAGRLRLLLVSADTLAEAMPVVAAELGAMPVLLLPAAGGQAIPMPAGGAVGGLQAPGLTRHDRRTLLRLGLIAPRIELRCPAPDAARAYRWGDYHFAESLAAALRARGCSLRIALAGDWETPPPDDLPPPDATLLLRGVRRCRPRPGPVNLMWMLSHPDRVADDELARYDHVFVASLPHAAALRARMGGRVSALLQCSDPARFDRPAPPGDPAPSHPLLFVGNSRRAERWVVSAALAAGHPLALYGAEWEGTVAEAALQAENIPNDRLADYYRNAGIVLNDHWPDMAARGFVSNRLFDLGMAGAFAISDSFEGAGMFFGTLVQVRDPEELDRAIRHFAARPDERARRAAAMQRLVRDRHTFDDRAARILERLRRLF